MASSPSSSSLSPLTPLHRLPEDVFLLIFSLLDAASLSRAARVCRRWRQIVASKTLWRRVRLPFVTKNKLRNFISRRLDPECRELSISGSCVLQSDNANLSSAAARKGVMSTAVYESIQSKLNRLESLEIRRDNLAASTDVGLIDFLELNISSLSLRECYVATEMFMGLSRLSAPTLNRLTSLDLSGSNRFDDFFLCRACDENYHYLNRQIMRYNHRPGEPAFEQPPVAENVQDGIPTEELPKADCMFLLKFPHLRTLKLNHLYRLTEKGIMMLTSWFNDRGERVSLRGRLARLELKGNKLKDRSVHYLAFLSSVSDLRLDGSIGLTPTALEHIGGMRQLEYLSVHKILDATPIAETLGIRRADSAMDQLLFRVFQNLKQLTRISLDGLFATYPPWPAMKLTLPFILEHLPKLTRVCICDGGHFLDIRSMKRSLDSTFHCYVCHGL